MLLVFVRALILYLVIVIIMRVMGKKQIGELQPSELVVALIMADLASVPMENTGIPMINGIVSILTLFIAEELLSYISLKSEKARGIICGKPSILVHKGKISQNELTKLRYNINDLLEQLRLKNFSNVEDVEYAILETSGQLSVIPVPSKKTITIEDMNLATKPEELPTTIIIDGRILSHNLKIIGLDEDWLNKELHINNIKSQKDIFFAFTTSDKKLHYQLKESAINSNKKVSK